MYRSLLITHRGTSTRVSKPTYNTSRYLDACMEAVKLIGKHFPICLTNFSPPLPGCQFLYISLSPRLPSRGPCKDNHDSGCMDPASRAIGVKDKCAISMFTIDIRLSYGAQYNYYYRSSRSPSRDPCNLCKNSDLYGSRIKYNWRQG